MNMDKMVRWVERKGKRVEFGNIVGPFVGKPYKYQLPTMKLAKELEELAKKVINGSPNPISPEIWKRYEIKEVA